MAKLQIIRARAVRALPKLHAANPAVHAMYFGAVAWQSGKVYGYIAAGLLVLTLCEMLGNLLGHGEGGSSDNAADLDPAAE